MATREITLRQFLDAVELNGYKQGFGHMYDDGPSADHIVSACALGQGALNLGISCLDLDEQLKEIADNHGISLFYRVTALNDLRHLSPVQIAKEMRKQYKKQLKTKISIEEYDYSYLSNYQGKRV